MLMDVNNEFGDAFSLILATGTHLFPGTIDLGLAGRDPGNGQPVYLIIVVLTAIVGATSTTQFRLATDSTATIDDTTSTEHLLTEQFTPAQLAQGNSFQFTLPGEGLVYEQFLGLQAIIATAAVTAGAISAFLTLDPFGWKSHADANN